MKQLLIARHGNTFAPNETPTRVGGRTDLPLVESGEQQARDLAHYLIHHNLIPEKIFTSHLVRTKHMAEILCDAFKKNIPVQALDIFNEIDYGPDENKTEDMVIARIGAQAIQDWDERAVVPPGWVVDPLTIIQSWKDFVAEFLDMPHHRVLVITSNGIARFAPHLTGDFDSFRKSYDIKIATGALCRLEYTNTTWCVKEWNVRPSKWLEAQTNT